jgi:HK97 family phage portal protein
MALFGIFGAETRSLENPSVSLNDAASLDAFFAQAATVTGDKVNEETALGVTSIWQAVNVVSGTIASLPAHLFKDTPDGAEKDTANPLYYILHDRPNDHQTAPAFYKWMVSRLLLGGRATAYIGRNKGGRVKALLPLDDTKLKIEQLVVGGEIKRFYNYEVGSTTLTYDSSEVIDLVWFPAADGFRHRNPVTTNRDAIALMIAAEKFAGKHFANGGVPPLVLNAPVAGSPQGNQRAVDNIADAVKASNRTKSQVLIAPAGHRIESIGIDPAKSQLVELRRFMVTETARIFNVPPTILHDLSNGTYSNVEQQNLNFVQQTLQPIIIMIEQEMNAKLFGARNKGNYFKFNLSGLLRGDFKARMEGLARAVNAALLTPNEARGLEDMPAKEGGDELLVQGATVPLSMAGQNNPTPPPISADEPSE